MNAAVVSTMNGSEKLRKEGAVALLLRVALASFTILLGFACLPLGFVFLPIAAPVLKWLSYVVLSTSGSLVVRWLLGKSTPLLQWLVTLTSFSAGMWLSGKLTHNYLGFPWQTLPYREIQVEALFAWGMMAGLAGFLLLISRGKASSVKVKPKSYGAQQTRRTTSRKVKSARKAPAVRTPKPISSRRSQKVRLRGKASARRGISDFSAWLRSVGDLGKETMLTSWRALKGSAGAIRRERSPWRMRVVRPSRSRSGVVHLSEQVEHRCPYCLEAIRPDDPRGVKVCPICHTPHHLDCWLVTGACQVPHSH